MSIVMGLLFVLLGVVIGVTLTVVGIRQLCREGYCMMAKRVDCSDGSDTEYYRRLFV